MVLRLDNPTWHIHILFCFIDPNAYMLDDQLLISFFWNDEVVI